VQVMVLSDTSFKPVAAGLDVLASQHRHDSHTVFVTPGTTSDHVVRGRRPSASEMKERSVADEGLSYSLSKHQSRCGNQCAQVRTVYESELAPG
jgi:hypothetical protein